MSQNEKYEADDKEKEILVSAMKEYFSYPRRSDKRREINDKALDALVALSPRSAAHWTTTKVRQWWTNNCAKYGCAGNQNQARRKKEKSLPPDALPEPEPVVVPEPAPKSQAWNSGRDLPSSTPSGLAPLFDASSAVEPFPSGLLMSRGGSSAPSRNQSTDNIFANTMSRASTSDFFGLRGDSIFSTSGMFPCLSRGSSGVDIADPVGDGSTWAGQSSQASERPQSGVQRGRDDDVMKARELYRKIKQLTDVTHEERAPKARELENDFRDFVRDFRARYKKGTEEYDVATCVKAETTRGAKLRGARVECSDEIGGAVGTTRGMVYTRRGDNNELEICCGERRAKTGFFGPPQGIFFSRELERVFIARESLVKCFRVDTLECVGTFDASEALTREATAALTVFFISGRCLLLLACEAVLLAWTLDRDTDEVQKPSSKTDQLEIPKITSICAVGEFLAVASSNYEVIHVYQMTEQEHVLTLYERLIGHSDSITCLKAVDGTRLLSGSLDGTVRLWDVTHARTEVFYWGHERVSSIDYGKNGTEFMVAAGFDGTVRLWSLSSKSAMIKISVPYYGLPEKKFHVTTVALDPVAKTVTMVVTCDSNSSNTQLHICQLEMGTKRPASVPF